MRVGSRGRIGCNTSHAVLGWIFATFLVAVAVLGPPLTGQSTRPMVELRHNVLMIDREFERWSVRTNKSSGPTGTLTYDDLGRASSTGIASKLRLRGATRDG
jgi:hypothetical protein